MSSKKNAILSTKCVVLMILADSEASWVYDIATAARETTAGHGSYPRTTIHTAVTALLEDKLIEACNPRGAEPSLGAARIYYRLTKSGKKLVEEYRGVLRTFAKMGASL